MKRLTGRNGEHADGKLHRPVRAQVEAPVAVERGVRHHQRRTETGQQHRAGKPSGEIARVRVEPPCAADFLELNFAGQQPVGQTERIRQRARRGVEHITCGNLVEIQHARRARQVKSARILELRLGGRSGFGGRQRLHGLRLGEHQRNGVIEKGPLVGDAGLRGVTARSGAQCIGDEAHPGAAIGNRLREELRVRRRGAKLQFDPRFQREGSKAIEQRPRIGGLR